MKILIILPVATNVFNEGIGAEAKSVAALDTEISVINLDRGQIVD
jgi:hypothetical protein